MMAQYIRAQCPYMVFVNEFSEYEEYTDSEESLYEEDDYEDSSEEEV